MKRYSVLLFIVVLIACQEKKEKPKATLDLNDFVNNYFSYFNAHDWDKMANLYSDTAIFRDPSLGTELVPQTRAQTIKKYSELQQTFTDLRDSVRSVYTTADSVMVVEFTSKGTAPDKSTFELPIVSIMKIKNGKIVSDFTYYDNF